MSEYKVGDKVWISGTVRQVSEREPNALYNTYVVEIDNYKGHTDQIPVRFREGELLARRLDTETEEAVVNAYVESVRRRERAAIAAWLRASGAVEDDAVADAVEAIGNSIERGDHLAGDDE